MVARDFQELVIWQRSHQLVLAIYRATDLFPKSEQFGLTNQLRRAAVSVPSNIAEGFERNGTKEFIQFLAIARGSLAEVQAQLLLSRDLLYIAPVECERLIQDATDVHKMINAFNKSLVAKPLEH